jgi:hypothetical protein
MRFYKTIERKEDYCTMQERIENTLSGIDNKRLGQVYSTNNEGTAAWANSEQVIDNSLVSIPAEYNVEKAKNWVDNGSQL